MFFPVSETRAKDRRPGGKTRAPIAVLIYRRRERLRPRLRLRLLPQLDRLRLRLGVRERLLPQLDRLRERLGVVRLGVVRLGVVARRREPEPNAEPRAFGLEALRF